MLRAYKYFITLTISGIFFLVPVSIVLIILGKIFHFFRGIQTSLHLEPEKYTMAIRVFADVIIVMVIILLCFFAGFFARAGYGKRSISWLETRILTLLPGYNFIKASTKGILGVSEEEFGQVVLVRLDDNYLLGFKVEAMRGKVVVFVPDAPRPLSGTLVVVEEERVILTGMTNRQAMSMIRRMGVGLAAALPDME